MAVDVSAQLPAQPAANAAEPGFHPRLMPRSTRVRPFSDTLADTLAAPGNDAGSSTPAAPKVLASRFPEVRGQIILTSQAESRPGANEVRGRIILAEDDVVKAPAVPDKTPEGAPRAVSSPASGPAPGFSEKSAQFTPEEESLLHVAARVSAPARRGATAKTPSRDESPPAQAAEAAQGSQPGQPGDLESLIKTASAQLGKRYSFGGESPRQGFDCSGFSSYVYSRNGLDLPRSSREQYSQGAPVERDKLRKGDLVFFGRKGINHVGIYLDDGKFIHAASSGGAVKVGDLDDPLWNKLYAGARRVL
jgi:cell wall-associated NlpC family hydrolase